MWPAGLSKVKRSPETAWGKVGMGAIEGFGYGNWGGCAGVRLDVGSG